MSPTLHIEMPEFADFPKMARLCRQVVITEKLDGTNAQILIVQAVPDTIHEGAIAVIDGLALYAGSRNRFLQIGDDNYAFAGWCKKNAEELMQLGVGRHFGEWWGYGIQRGYGLKEKRFSLFNVARWCDAAERPESFAAEADRPACCGIVPTIYRGDFDMDAISAAESTLRAMGSLAAPGFMRPEGLVVFHTAANRCFKKTLDNDGLPKSLAPLLSR